MIRPSAATLTVGDVDAIVGETIDSGVCHQAIFKNPDGNVLDLHHRYASPDARPH